MKLPSHWIGALYRNGIAALLAAAAIPKVLDPTTFAARVAAYEWPGTWWLPLAWLLPWLELTAAAALIAIPTLRRGGWLLAIALFLVFAAAVASLLLRRMQIPCGCLPGIAELPPSWWHVAANLALAALSAVGLRHEPTPPLPRARPRDGGPCP
ncbi:MAG: hypothetical protein N2652_01335 [Kiritimatiellae bacterium]|nr:hypothetical protein [Kiritimatiellia bacterium]